MAAGAGSARLKYQRAYAGHLSNQNGPPRFLLTDASLTRPGHESVRDDYCPSSFLSRSKSRLGGPI